MKICGYCGSQLDDAAVACSYCGRVIVAGGEQVSFNPSTRVLTLKNATIGGTNYNSISTVDEGITINVIGTNTINDIYLGNGASELITMAMQGLLNNGDEMLVPMPDYPLWTACATLAGGIETIRVFFFDD